MPIEKVSASLDADLMDEVRATVGPRGVSAFLNQAACEKLQRQRILRLLDDLDNQHGPPSAAARAAAAARIAQVLE